MRLLKYLTKRAPIRSLPPEEVLETRISALEAQVILQRNEIEALSKKDRSGLHFLKTLFEYIGFGFLLITMGNLYPGGTFFHFIITILGATFSGIIPLVYIAIYTVSLLRDRKSETASPRLPRWA